MKLFDGCFGDRPQFLRHGRNGQGEFTHPQFVRLKGCDLSSVGKDIAFHPDPQTFAVHGLDADHAAPSRKIAAALGQELQVNLRFAFSPPEQFLAEWIADAQFVVGQLIGIFHRHQVGHEMVFHRVAQLDILGIEIFGTEIEHPVRVGPQGGDARV